MTSSYYLTNGPVVMVTCGMLFDVNNDCAWPSGRKRYAPLRFLPFLVPYVTKSIATPTSSFYQPIRLITVVNSNTLLPCCR